MVFSKWNSFFFCHDFISQITENSQNSREREGNILIPLPFPPAYKDLDLSLQFCKWADYHVFSIASLVIIILPLTLREKCPNTEFFLVRIFPHSQWIRGDTLRIQSKCRKIRTRKRTVFGHFSRSVNEIYRLEELLFDWSVM